MVDTSNEALADEVEGLSLVNVMGEIGETIPAAAFSAATFSVKAAATTGRLSRDESLDGIPGFEDPVDMLPWLPFLPKKPSSPPLVGTSSSDSVDAAVSSSVSGSPRYDRLMLQPSEVAAP